MVTPPLRAESSSVKGVTPPTGVKAGSPHLRQVLRERGGAAPSQRAGTPRTQPEGTGLGSLLCRGGWPQFPHLCHGPASKPSRSPSSGYLGPLLPLSFLQPQWVPGQGGTLGPRPACDLSVPAPPPHTQGRTGTGKNKKFTHRLLLLPGPQLGSMGDPGAEGGPRAGQTPPARPGVRAGPEGMTGAVQRGRPEARSTRHMLSGLASAWPHWLLLAAPWTPVPL